MQTEHKGVLDFGIVGSRHKYIKGKRRALKGVIPLSELIEDIINGLSMNHSRNTTAYNKPCENQSPGVIHLVPL
jgi:hypothetical protein